MTKLKPCPFCGSEAQIFTLSTGWYVRCTASVNKCKVMPCTRPETTPYKAVRSWNRRAEVPKRIDGKPAGMSAEQFDACYEEDGDADAD